MGRFEDVLRHLSIEGPALEIITRAVKNFLAASKELQRHLLPLNGSVHAGLSRITTQRNDEATTLIQWITIYDRVGLLNVDDAHVSRLIDAALRYVWRKEEADALIAETGGAGSRLLVVRDALRALRDSGGVVGADGGGSGSAAGRGRSGGAVDVPGLTGEPSVAGAEASLPTISSTRPPLCVAPPTVIAVVKTVIELISASENPVAQCREVVTRVFASFQEHVVGRETLTRAASSSGSAANVGTLTADVVAAAALVGATPPGAAESAGAAAGSASSGATETLTPPAGTDGATARVGSAGQGAFLGPPPPPPVAAEEGDGQLDGQGDRQSLPPSSSVSGDGSAGAVAEVAVAAAAAAATAAAATDGGDGGGGGGAPWPGGQAAGGAETNDGEAGSTANGGGAMKLSNLLDMFRRMWWATWRSPTKGVKAVAPEGTVANPTGRHTELRFRSMWCQRVCMVAVKIHLQTPALDARRLKVADTLDVVILEDMTNFRYKNIPVLVALLLLLCTHEEDAVDIVKNVVAEGISARRSRHRSLVPSVKELERRATGAGRTADGSIATDGALVRSTEGARDGGGTDCGDARPSPSGESGTRPPGGAGTGAPDGSVQGAPAGGGRGTPPGAGRGARAGSAGRGARSGVAGGGAARGTGQLDEGAGDTIRTDRTVATDAAFFFQAASKKGAEAAAARAKRMGVRRTARALLSSTVPVAGGGRSGGPKSSPPPKRRRLLSPTA